MNVEIVTKLVLVQKKMILKTVRACYTLFENQEQKIQKQTSDVI